MVCTRCGLIGADVRPDWRPHVQQTARVTLGSARSPRSAHSGLVDRFHEAKRIGWMELKRDSSAKEHAWKVCPSPVGKPRRVFHWTDANGGVPNKYFLRCRIQPMRGALVTSVQLVTCG